MILILEKKSVSEFAEHIVYRQEEKGSPTIIKNQSNLNNFSSSKLLPCD